MEREIICTLKGLMERESERLQKQEAKFSNRNFVLKNITVKQLLELLRLFMQWSCLFWWSTV